MTKDDTARLFDKLDALRETSIRVEERLSHLKEDVVDLKNEFDRHEDLGETRYLSLTNTLTKFRGKIYSLENKTTIKSTKKFLTPKVIVPAVTALLTALGSAWAYFGKAAH